jgi:hypothetical protein
MMLEPMQRSILEISPVKTDKLLTIAGKAAMGKIPYK